MKNRHGTLEHRFLHSIMQLTSLVTETFVISILPIKILHTKPYGTEWYGSLFVRYIHGARRRMTTKVNAIKRWLSHRLEFLTCGLRVA